MSQEITGTRRRNVDKGRRDKAVTEPATRDKAATLGKLRLVNYSIAGLREHRNGTCSNQEAVLEEDCKQWIFVDGTASRVLLKGTDAKRSKVDTENAKLANYRNEEYSDLRNTVKTKTTIVRRRNGGGIMIHHMEPDFRNTEVDNALGLKRFTEAYEAVWKEVSYCSQKRVRIPLLSSTRTDSQEGHAQLAMDALVASLETGGARLTKWLEEAEVVELCVPFTREHAKVAKNWSRCNQTQ